MTNVGVLGASGRMGREVCRAVRVPDNGSIGSRIWQTSEGLIRPRNPGNAGGGKEPWFGVALERAEVGRLA